MDLLEVFAFSWTSMFDAETLTFFRILDFQHSGLLHAHFVLVGPGSPRCPGENSVLH